MAMSSGATLEQVATATITDHDIDSIAAGALEHRAMHHPWLVGIENSTLPNPEQAIRDFAWHYQAYSAWFPRYLAAVAERLEDPQHRALIQDNLEEESGALGTAERAALAAAGIDTNAIAGVPHPELFRRFCHAIGLTDRELEHPPAAALRWRRQFLHFLQTCSPAAGIGALGPATEGIVSTLYTRMLRGIRRLPNLQRADYVFFELHCVVDDKHQEDLLRVARALASTPEGHRELVHGVETSLGMRSAFYDQLHARAQSRRWEVQAS